MASLSRNPCPRCGADVSSDWTHCGVCGTPQIGADEVPDAWIGRVIDRKYTIEGVLGVGGMGMVFRARRALVGDTIALKVLYPRFLESPLQRRLFAAEAVASARLSHPNVVHVYDADRDADGIAYLAMEVLEGRTFRDLLREEAPLHPATLLPLAIQICRGLEAAHQARIIHRDLKPDNIVLVEQPGGGTQVKLLDFGIAAMLDVDNRDEARKLLGTLRYMSPEQCRGEEIDVRSDLYSLGVVLYEALTRRRATGKTLTAVINDPVVAPNEILPPTQHIPIELEDLLLSLLAKYPEERPPSATAVARHCEHILASLSRPRIEAPDPEPLRPASPNRFLWIGLGLATAVGITAGILWGIFG
jgi:serine/threonine protein kinase